jgi:type VI secretion system protein VasG
MATVNLKSLVGKLNPLCRRALEGAAGLCLSRTNYNVEIEHWLLKLLEPANTDLSRILKQYNADISRLTRDLTHSLDKLRTGNARAPELSADISDLMREAWVLTSLEFAGGRIRSGYLLAALLLDRTLSGRMRSSSPELAKIPAEQLQKEIKSVIAGSAEDEAEAAEAPAGATAGDGQNRVAPGSKTPNLDQFTENLTEKARKGKIDPVIGRDFEIRQVIDILTRRRQNNPILTGDAGVGKTAVVEGFALRVAEGDVPESLKNVDVRMLDMGLLQAGAGVKGEFENRLKSVIQEVKTSPKPVILFIDEAHTMIGAGGAAGQNDAANLLKPALARGELRTVAATTWMEYKKYFETDAALKRRFQVVKVEEPSIKIAITMMQGVTDMLESHHKVRVLAEAIEDSVKLSARYITDRQLPDKCVSLLDTACAKVALGQSSTPSAVEDVRRDIDHMTIEMGMLEREEAVGKVHEERLGELQEKKAAAQEKLTALEKRWAEEKRLVADIQKLRARLEIPLEIQGKQARLKKGGLKPEEEQKLKEQLAKLEKERAKPEEEAQLKASLTAVEKELHAVQGEAPLMSPVVDSQAIAEVVSGWTGIPLGKVVRDELKTVMQLKDRLRDRVVGQDHALAAIAERIQAARAKLVDPRRPIGVFMFVGPSGVGKTETAMALADILYSGDRSMVIINMSEYKESSKISNLTGSAKGLVGYGEPGALTDPVRRKPHCIVLLDEVEKAHVDIQELFYQVFDKGMLSDSSGNDINFKNTIIILTSNVGTDTIMKLCADPDTAPDAEGLAVALRPDLLKSFKPALLGRMSVVPFFPLGDEVLRQIIHMKLKQVADRVRENHRGTFTYDDAVVKTIQDRCKEVESGARNVDHIINGTLLPELAAEVLGRMAEGQPVQKINVGVSPEGKFVYQV